MELADMRVLETRAARREGSTPSVSTHGRPDPDMDNALTGLLF